VPVERALFLSHWDGVLPDGYQRLYFGAEFCSWAFPPLKQILSACCAAHQAGLPVTLVTPILRQETLTELRSLFNELKSHLVVGDEVVISDFGALQLTRDL